MVKVGRLSGSFWWFCDGLLRDGLKQVPARTIIIQGSSSSREKKERRLGWFTVFISPPSLAIDMREIETIASKQASKQRFESKSLHCFT
jgi:hypothetical protein